MSNLKDTYNRIAEDWQRDHHQDDWWVKGVDAFISLLPPHGRVVDVGCGTGVKSKYLLEHGMNVLGTDFSEAMVTIAKREVPGGTFQVGDIKQVGDLEGMFDGLFMQAVLLHIPKKQVLEILRQADTKLANGGYLYVAVKEQRTGGVEEEEKEEEDYGYKYQRFFSYFTSEDLRSFFHDLGYKVVFENRAVAPDTAWLQIIGQKPKEGSAG